MKTGLLWFDDDPKRNLEEKIRRAVARYREKYERPPDTCYVHPSQANGLAGQQVAEVCIAALSSVLPHHFWIGCEEPG